MERTEYPDCVYRAQDGRIVPIPWPEGEPDRETMGTDLYAPWYTVAKGLFGPPRVREAEITIFNTPHYRRDPELEAEAKERLLKALLAKEGVQVVQASGGVETVRGTIRVQMLWLDRPNR